MNNRTKGVILLSVGAALIAAALALGGYNLWDDHRAQTAASEVLEQLEIPETSSPDASAKPGGTGAETPVPDHVLDPYREMPTVEVDGYRYIGKISVPSLELELPVMDTWDYTRLKLAPCRYAGSAYLPGFVVCAHNYTAHFGRLKNLSPGDGVIFTDVEGNTFSYEVAEIETLSPTAVEEMKSDGWDLTLFSCTLGGQSRVTVRCTRAQSA